jgi:hypothetical protein
VETFLEILTSIKIVGPIGVVAIVEGWVLYLLFNRLEDLQTKRLEDWKQMQNAYQNLANEINHTLDVLLKAFGRKNGNGSSEK